MIDAMLKKLIFIFTVSTLLSLNALSQDAKISPNRYTTGEQYLTLEVVEYSHSEVTLSIEWDKSWRDAENWDAGWIILKGKTESGTLEHVEITQTPNVVQNRSEENAAAEIYVPEDRTGFFIHRANVSEGDNNWTVKIQTPANQHYTDMRSYGVEMVYVPQGKFELGTTRSLRDRKAARSNEWIRFTPPAPLSAFFRADPDGEDYYGGTYEVDSKDPITIGNELGDLYYLDAKFLEDFTSGDKKGVLRQEFPKGFQGFYQMKYEVTEQQYVDFLNGLTPEKADERWFKEIESRKPNPWKLRYTIRKTESEFTTERPHRAAAYLSWDDALAWADWMGLRPMTGLEFEKSARGPKPAKFREFTWGENELESSESFRKDGKIMNPDGSLAETEEGPVKTDGNIHVFIRDQLESSDNLCTPDGENYFSWYPACRALKGGDAKWGPLRVGIHGVDSGGDRVNAGAGYYGSMDLGGNLNEQMVTLGVPQGRKFQGTHGDGTLTSDGFATNNDWSPHADKQYISSRGAGWSSHPNHARIADRFGGLVDNGNRRSAVRGFRAVRTTKNEQRNH
jgi:formylglycine-generating enzyme required for sulfatase activity